MPRTGSTYDPKVPTYGQLQINTPVSIVLKADQPTGRQVQGFISEVLTGGDHPRGIKVRLTDGRVGRVQKLASAEEAEAGTSTQSLGRNGESAGPAVSTARAPRIMYNDVREDGYDYDMKKDEPGPSLEDYIVTKPARKKKGRAAAPVCQGETGPEEPTIDQTPSADQPGHNATAVSEKTVCPVCHAFEGDEAAVAHHVGTHFE